ncbi:hypothetical protein FS749_011995 [Ceratobasidium sp. UAMH 11750]|nr:hypothetical protein FS749_011995 [Ceratobasidium sp. UAMH 11750]
MDMVYPRAGLLPGPRGDVFGPPRQNLDIVGARPDDMRVLSMPLMQPGRPLSQAKNVGELKAAFVGAIMGQWALVNSHVQHRDISINNVLLSLPEYEYEASECEQLRILGAEASRQTFKAPAWETTFNDPTTPKNNQTTELKWKFDPKRRFAFLERVVAELGPRPFGFLSDVDLANILPIARVGVSDTQTVSGCGYVH